MKSIKKIILFFLIGFTSLGFSQSTEPYDMIENALAGSVTVAIYKTDVTKRPLGFRGDGASDQAYEKALDLAGAQSSGSGFIIQVNGKKYVITNAHVVEKASLDPGSIYVFSITRKKYEMKIVGGDSFYDIAVLEFVEQPGNEIQILDFKTEEPRIGEKVYAIGNPFGDYPYTVTDGIISAKNRVRGSLTGKFGFLQTSATVIWGNSGGPLIDNKGKVAGINSQIAIEPTASGEQMWLPQINFALEASIAKRLVNDIINNNGLVKRCFVGIECIQKYRWERINQRDGLWRQSDEWPVLSSVIKTSPSYSTLAPYIGNQIVKINNHDTRSLEELLGELEMHTAGKELQMTFLKNGVEVPVKVSTRVLSIKDNEEIAKHVMGRNNDVKMDYSTEQVSFTFNPTQLYMNQQQKYNKGQGNNAAAKYYVLAAGITGENVSEMWKVMKLSDLGTSLRLSGLSGVLDFYVARVGDPSNNVDSFRINFSGNDNVMQKVLWY